MKKPLIKALGVILSAAMICGSVPAGVSPALAAEVTEGVSPAPVMEVSAEAAATNEVSVIDTGNEEKESDNSSTDPDEDATSVSGNAAEDETGEAASDDETEEVDGSDNYFAGKVHNNPSRSQNAVRQLAQSHLYPLHNNQESH